MQRGHRFQERLQHLFVAGKRVGDIRDSAVRHAKTLNQYVPLLLSILITHIYCLSHHVEVMKQNVTRMVSALVFTEHLRQPNVTATVVTRLWSHTPFSADYPPWAKVQFGGIVW